jgi:hypothetical protein
VHCVLLTALQVAQMERQKAREKLAADSQQLGRRVSGVRMGAMGVMAGQVTVTVTCVTVSYCALYDSHHDCCRCDIYSHD